MDPLGAASAAGVFAAAPSKVPFYVAGGLLACWAVLVAGFGITHARFPGSGAKARLVVLISGALVAATVTSAVATAGEGEEAGGAGEGPGRPAGAAPPPSSAVQLAADPEGQLAFDKKRVVVKAGAISIRLTNESPLPHNVRIATDGKTLATTKTIQRATTTLSAQVPPGEYVFYCAVPGHREGGMEGTLTAR
jgi:plastocyanin